MRVVGLILIVTCFVAGVSFYSAFVAQQQVGDICTLPPPSALPPPPTIVEGWVYAVEEIPEGSIIREEQIALRQATTQRGFDPIVGSINEVAGLRVKFGIQAGQILSYHDVELPNKSPNFPKEKRGRLILRDTNFRVK